MKQFFLIIAIAALELAIKIDDFFSRRKHVEKCEDDYEVWW